MTIAYTKLPGLDREKLLAVVEPVLRAHRVDGVELIWRGDGKGMVLSLTIERAEAQQPGAGVTIDLCSEISRDLSAALDVAEVIHAAYRLEVGSPGLDRPLHLPSDYRRFAGQRAKIKLKEPLEGEEGTAPQRMVRGTLFGLDEEDRVQVETESGTLSLDFDNISSARLIFDWKQSSGQKARSNGSGRKSGTKRSK